MINLKKKKKQLNKLFLFTQTKLIMFIAWFFFLTKVYVKNKPVYIFRYSNVVSDWLMY